jgi:peroxiredoxin
MPDVKRLADQAHRQGWRVYGINVSESADKAQWFVQNYQTNFPVLLDQSGRVADQFGLVGFPTFILLDQNGRTIYDGHTIPQNF